MLFKPKPKPAPVGIYVSDTPIGVEQGQRQVFASYHLMTEDKKESGFGNIVANFDPSQYEGALDKFVFELQKSIQLVNEQRLGKPVIVQVLWFR